MEHLKRYLPLASLLLLSLTACSAQESSQEETQEVQIKAADQVDSQAIEKVNTLFTLSPTAQQAQEAALAQCMTARGQTWVSSSAKLPYDVRSQLDPSPLSLAQAQAEGYSSHNYSQTQSLPNLTEEAMLIYMGDPSQGSISVEGVPGSIAANGCLAESYTRVFGSAESGVFFESGILNLTLPYVNAVIHDSRSQELDQAWSACMKEEEGIEIASPALATIDTSLGPHQMAVADAQCREQVNYEEKTREILNSYLTTFLAENEGLIDQLTEAKKTAEQNAPEILAN